MLIKHYTFSGYKQESWRKKIFCIKKKKTKTKKTQHRILHLKDTAQVGVTSIKCSVGKILQVQEVKEDKSLSLHVSSSETGLKKTKDKHPPQTLLRHSLAQVSELLMNK